MLYWSGKLIFKNQFAEFSFLRIPKVSFFRVLLTLWYPVTYVRLYSICLKNKKKCICLLWRLVIVHATVVRKRKTSERLSDLVCNAKVSTIIVRCKNASNRHQTLRVSLASSLYQRSMNYDSCTDNICFFHINFFSLDMYWQKYAVYKWIQYWNTTKPRRTRRLLSCNYCFQIGNILSKQDGKIIKGLRK